MNKLLIALICLMVSSVSAQELFPEFASYERITEETDTPVAAQQEVPAVQDISAQEVISENADTAVSETEAAVVTDEVADVNEKDLFAESKNESEAVVDEPAVEEEEEEEEEEDKQIVIYMKEAEARLMPQKAFSFCQGVIAVANPLKKPIQQLNFSLRYGSFDTSYKVRDLQPGKEYTEELVLLDDACDYIMSMPVMKVTRCVVENMEEKDCIKRVVFIPLSE